jgi:hypothetical protein
MAITQAVATHHHITGRCRIPDRPVLGLFLRLATSSSSSSVSFSFSFSFVGYRSPFSRSFTDGWKSLQLTHKLKKFVKLLISNNSFTLFPRLHAH